MAARTQHFESIENSKILMEKAAAAASYWASKLYIAAPELPTDSSEGFGKEIIQRNVESTAEKYPIDVEKIKAFENNLKESIGNVLLSSEFREHPETRNVMGMGRCQIGFWNYEPDTMLQEAADQAGINNPLRLYLPMTEYVLIEPGNVVVMKGGGPFEPIATLYHTKDDSAI